MLRRHTPKFVRSTHSIATSRWDELEDRTSDRRCAIAATWLLTKLRCRLWDMVTFYPNKSVKCHSLFQYFIDSHMAFDLENLICQNLLFRKQIPSKENNNVMVTSRHGYMTIGDMVISDMTNGDMSPWWLWWHDQWWHDMIDRTRIEVE